MAPTEVSAVMLDLGDTLFEPLDSSYVLENLNTATSTVKLETDPRELLSEFRSTRVRIERELSESNSTFYLHRDFIAKVVSDLFANLDSTIPYEVVQRFCDAQRDAVVGNLRPREDCTSTLSRLRDLGYKLAIVSNIDDEWLEPLNERWNLDQMVDAILSSECAQSCKPDSSIFFQACRMIDVHPHEVVFVGDSLVNDVEGSRSVGMEPVWFDPSSTRPPHGQSVRSITTLGELVDILSYTGMS